MNVNLELLKTFENSLYNDNTQKEQIDIRILGYGELSVVFEILDDINGNAYKRLTIFEEEEQIRSHILVFKEYNRILNREIGINTPPYELVWFKDKFENLKFYYIQEKLPCEAIGNKAICYLDKSHISKLVLLILREMKKVWMYNERQSKIKVGLDAQISNFAIENFDLRSRKLDEKSNLIFLDTIPPFYRIGDIEAMDLNLFLKSVPLFLKWILKMNSIQKMMYSVINRYYDFRLTAIDLLANFSKEQKPDIIPSLVKTVNKFLIEEASEFAIKPITLEEIMNFYLYDRMIWILFQNLRKIDRFIIRKLFRKPYEFFLPPKIRR